jgi:hypothetical protein
LLISGQILNVQTFGFIVVKRAFSDEEMNDITTAFEQFMLNGRNGLSFDGKEREAMIGMVEWS